MPHWYELKLLDPLQMLQGQKYFQSNIISVFWMVLKMSFFFFAPLLRHFAPFLRHFAPFHFSWLFIKFGGPSSIPLNILSHKTFAKETVLSRKCVGFVTPQVYSIVWWSIFDNTLPELEQFGIQPFRTLRLALGAKAEQFIKLAPFIGDYQSCAAPAILNNTFQVCFLPRWALILQQDWRQRSWFVHLDVGRGCVGTVWE